MLGTRLAGKTAIITGGGSGIGRAVCIQFASEGAQVAVADLSHDGATETVRVIKAAHGEAIAIQCNVAKSEEVQQLVALVSSSFGGVDILFNGAALSKRSPPDLESVMDMTEEHWQASLNVNLSSYFLCAKYVLPVMKRRGGGVIVNVSSASALGSGGGSAAYATTKAAILTLTKSMALDYGPMGVRVNAICPGPIDTPRNRISRTPGEDGAERVRQLAQRNPLGRIGTPEEVAKLALFLASEDASYITGAVITIDGGASLGSRPATPRKGS